MGVLCYDHGTSYDTVKCHFTEISEPQWVPPDERRCKIYYELSDKIRVRHAVRRVHTNCGSMHFPSAMNTTNDVNNEGDVDTTEQDTTNVTIRDRNATSDTTPSESRGERFNSHMIQPVHQLLQLVVHLQIWSR